MRKSSIFKLGFGLLIAASTMLAPKSVQADLCVRQYTLPNGQVCFFAGYIDGCCRYVSTNSAAICPPICAM
jgi:hypothetical protein